MDGLIVAGLQYISAEWCIVGVAPHVYHKPDEKPPGGMRFLLITCLAPFNAGMVVLISAATRLYPSPVTGFPSKITAQFGISLIQVILKNKFYL